MRRLGSPLPRTWTEPVRVPSGRKVPVSAASVCQVQAGPRVRSAAPVVKSFITEAAGRNVSLRCCRRGGPPSTGATHSDTASAGMPWACKAAVTGAGKDDGAAGAGLCAPAVAHPSSRPQARCRSMAGTTGGIREAGDNRRLRMPTS